MLGFVSFDKIINNDLLFLGKICIASYATPNDEFFEWYNFGKPSSKKWASSCIVTLAIQSEYFKFKTIATRTDELLGKGTPSHRLDKLQRLCMFLLHKIEGS